MSFPASWCIRVFTTARLHASATCQISFFTFPPLEASGAWWPSNEFGPQGLVWGAADQSKMSECVHAIPVYSEWNMDWCKGRLNLSTQLMTFGVRQKAHAIAILDHPLMMIDAQICWWTRASEQHRGSWFLAEENFAFVVFAVHVWAHYSDRSGWRQRPYPNALVVYRMSSNSKIFLFRWYFALSEITFHHTHEKNSIFILAIGLLDCWLSSFSTSHELSVVDAFQGSNLFRLFCCRVLGGQSTWGYKFQPAMETMCL